MRTADGRLLVLYYDYLNKNALSASTFLHSFSMSCPVTRPSSHRNMVGNALQVKLRVSAVRMRRIVLIRLTADRRFHDDDMSGVGGKRFLHCRLRFHAVTAP